MKLSIERIRYDPNLRWPRWRVVDADGHMVAMIAELHEATITGDHPFTTAAEYWVRYSGDHAFETAAPYESPRAALVAITAHLQGAST